MALKKLADNRFEKDEQGRTIYYRQDNRDGYVVDTPARERQLRQSVMVAPLVTAGVLMLWVASRNICIVGAVCAALLPMGMWYDHYLVRGLARTSRPRQTAPLTMVQRANLFYPKPILFVLSLVGWLMAALGGLGIVLGLKGGVTTLGAAIGISLIVALTAGGVWIGCLAGKAFRYKAK